VGSVRVTILYPRQLQSTTRSMHSTPLSDSPPRLYFLDWLRIVALLVLVLYHVGMYYVRWDFHVKSPFAGPGLEPWMKLSGPWRMDLLFMVSGAATALMLKAGATGGLLRKHTKFLLLPLLCGMLFIVPPQSYFEVVQKFGYSGDYLSFLKLYFRHYQGFCQGGNCLILPTWNHLWFLPYLWLYTLLLWGAIKVWPASLVTSARFAEKLLAGARLAVVPIAVIFTVRISLFAPYPSTHAMWGDWFNHTMYFGMFVIGTVFATQPSMWLGLVKWRWPALVAALGCWAVLVGLRPARPLEHLVIATMQWGALVAALGFAQKLCNVDHPLRQRLTEAVFPVYIFHQTVIIVASQAMLPWQWTPAIEGPVLVAVTLLLSYAGYDAVRRVGFLRPWFGLRNRGSDTEFRHEKNLSTQAKQTRSPLNQTTRNHRAMNLTGAVVNAGYAGIVVVALYG
jgi:glucans biosynthesis protein C